VKLAVGLLELSVEQYSLSVEPLEVKLVVEQKERSQCKTWLISKSKDGKPIIKQKFYSSLPWWCGHALPGGMLIDGKEKILKSLAAQPWKSFQIEELSNFLIRKCWVLVYRVTAREGNAPCSSHQQHMYLVMEWIGSSPADTGVDYAQVATGTPQTTLG